MPQRTFTLVHWLHLGCCDNEFIIAIIGATLIIHSHRFKIISADLYVYRHMKENSELFSEHAIAGVREFLLRNGHLKGEVRLCLSHPTPLSVYWKCFPTFLGCYSKRMQSKPNGCKYVRLKWLSWERSFLSRWETIPRTIYRM